MKKLYIERFYLNRGQRRIPYDCTYHPAIEGCRTDTHLRGTAAGAQVAAFSTGTLCRASVNKT